MMEMIITMVLRLMNVFFRNVKSLKEGLNTGKKEIEDLKVITVLLNSRDIVKVENEICALRVSLENLKKEVSSLHSWMATQTQLPNHLSSSTQSALPRLQRAGARPPPQVGSPWPG